MGTEAPLRGALHNRKRSRCSVLKSLFCPDLSCRVGGGADVWDSDEEPQPEIFFRFGCLFEMWKLRGVDTVCIRYRNFFLVRVRTPRECSLTVICGASPRWHVTGENRENWVGDPAVGVWQSSVWVGVQTKCPHRPPRFTFNVIFFVFVFLFWSQCRLSMIYSSPSNRTLNKLNITTW